MIYITIYYVSVGYVQIVLPINRKSILVINRTPLFDYIFDSVIFLILTFIIAILLELDTHRLILLLLMDVIGFYLVSINIPGGFLLALSVIVILYYMSKEKHLLLYILLYFLSLLAVIDVIVIAFMLLSKTISPSLTLLYNYVFLKERSIWSLIEYVSVILFVIYTWMIFAVFLDKLLGEKLGVYKTLSKYARQFLSIVKGRGGYLTIISGYKGLILSLLFNLLLIIYLHSPIHNPEFMPVSVDTYFYWKFFLLADKYGLRDALMMHNFGRPAYLIVLYCFYSWVRNPILLMDVIHPIIALSLLIVAVYLVSNKYWGPRVAGYSALLTAVGHSCITFIAGGYQANALALALALLWLYFYPEKQAVFAVLALIVLLIHPWTFFMYAAIMIGYYTLINKFSEKELYQLYLVFIIVYVVGEFVNRILFSISPAIIGFKPVYNAFLQLSLPSGWISVFEIWTWGSQGNAVILLFSLPAVEYSFVSLSLALLAPAAIFTGQLIMYRLLLNIPIEILVAKTLTSIDKRIAFLTIVLALTKTLIIANALEPLDTYPWINILE